MAYSWVADNLYSADIFTVDSQSNATASEIKVIFNDVGYVKLSKSWNYIEDDTNFATTAFRLAAVLEDTLETPIQYRGDTLIQIDVWYWVPSTDSFVKQRGVSYITPLNSITQSPSNILAIVAIDPQYLIAQLDITFRCTEYLSQILDGIVLQRSYTDSELVRQEVNSYLTRGALTDASYYTDGFRFDYGEQYLAYKTKVDGGKITALIHQPSGFTVNIKYFDTPMPDQ